MATNTISDLLTVEEIASLLRVKPSWVYTHAEELGALRLGKYLRFSWERVMERLGQGQSPLGSQPNDQIQTAESKPDQIDETQLGNRSLFS
jgi:excisionase family DNA binding protein